MIIDMGSTEYVSSWEVESEDGEKPMEMHPDQTKNTRLRCFSCRGTGHVTSMCLKKKIALAE